MKDNHMLAFTAAVCSAALILEIGIIYAADKIAQAMTAMAGACP